MRLSVIIAAHNEGGSLWRTVQSSIEGLRDARDYEIVVADDASDDGSVEEMLRRFPRVCVVRHQQRRGTSPTKDLGAREARGEVFVFLDGHANAEPGAILRLVEDVEHLNGKAVVTPTVQGLDVGRWRNTPCQVGHGYRLELERFDCGWLPLGELRQVQHKGRRFYESPALIGCALAVGRALYDDLRGFDPHMRSWGVEDLDFGLKCWLMGFSILHDAEAVIGHRFRESFDNYDVPIEHLVVNQLRTARKNFTQSVWSEWAERCRTRHPGRLADHPQGLWARIWQLFEADRKSVEHERSYLMARRVRDEFWYAQRFGLTWPRVESAPFAAAATGFEAMAAQRNPSPSPSPSPSPPPCQVTGVNPASVTICVGEDQQFTAEGTNLDAVTWSTAPPGTPPSGGGDQFATRWSSAGSKTVTASCNGTSEDSTVTVVAVDRVIVDGSSPENLGPEDVCVGSSITLRAMPDPAGASFPAGRPVWKILSQPTGSTVGDPPAGSPTAPITPTHVGTYTVEAKCGTSADVFQINAVVVDLDIEGVPGDKEVTVGGLVVRRAEGNNAPRKKITLYCTSSGNVTLTRNNTKVKVFTAPSGGTEITFTDGDNNFPVSALPSLYVQGDIGSSTMRDVTLTLTHDESGASDNVRFTVLWVDISWTRLSTDTVPADNSRLQDYIDKTGDDELGLLDDNDGVRAWWYQIKGVVSPRNFDEGEEIDWTQDAQGRVYMNNGFGAPPKDFSAEFPPGNDGPPISAQDKAPQSGGSGGKVYYLDGPAIWKDSQFPKDTIVRNRANFKAAALYTGHGYTNQRCSEIWTHYVRFSMKKTDDPPGNTWVDPADVANDKQANSGSLTKLSWDLNSPTVTGIAPNNGTNDGTVDITNLAGTSFLDGATVKLTKAGQAEIAATNLSYESVTKITCTFDLTGKAAGDWNVVVINPADESNPGTLANGFTISEP